MYDSGQVSLEQLLLSWNPSHLRNKQRATKEFSGQEVPPPSPRLGPLKSIQAKVYRRTWLIRNRHPLGPCSRTMPRVLGGSLGGGQFLMSEVPL